MSSIRIYQATPLAVNTSIQLSEKASHHVGRVLRAKPGDQLTLFNGQGGEYAAVIKRITKKEVEVDIIAFMAREVESPIDIHLAQGIARGEKMDFIVQKAVELGVKKIIPLITERCNVRLDNEREEKRLQHWQSVAISACEQSGRNYLPEVTAPISFNDWLPHVNADCCFVLSPHETNTLTHTKMPVHTSIVLLIGPEGGLSDAEVNAAKQRHFLPLNLGPRVMRTETAPIAAIAILQYQYGDLGECMQMHRED